MIVFDTLERRQERPETPRRMSLADRATGAIGGDARLIDRVLPGVVENPEKRLD